jgi:U3 small nucleolar RNA-associated protein 14
MAPSGRTARPGRAPSTAQRKNNNVTGFAKRQASKAKGPAVSDVYEFQEQKQRRSRTSVDTRLGHNELAELGPVHRNGSEEEEEDKKELRARLIGENDENEVLGSDEDEEIDSDAAFEEEDDDRYAGFNFPTSKVRAP